MDASPMPSACSVPLNGAAERNRTSDPTLTKGVLYP